MKKALISVSDKTNLVAFAKGLQACQFELIATDSTKQYLEDHGLEGVVAVSDVTGFPEMLEGRVKTLHPKIHGGILAKRNDDHQSQLQKAGIDFIDLVCVNLYPFAQNMDKGQAVAIENIDIGGPTLLRAAAKNFEHVIVTVDPQDYEAVLAQLQQGAVDQTMRQQLAAKVFATMSQYDQMIASYLGHQDLGLHYHLKQTLRYGENPFQQASFYVDQKPWAYAMSHAQQIHGKELSYNNIQDGNAALELMAEFDDCACVALKHGNPCGVALGNSDLEAFEKAYAADSVSIFGGIVAFNRPVTVETAEKLHELFIELVLAPSFEDQALAVLTKKKNIRLMTYQTQGERAKCMLRSVAGGVLVQDADLNMTTNLTSVTNRKTDREAELLFAMRVCKHVKSNAIVLAKDGATVGIGCGQMNRVGALKIAIEQAGSKARGSVMASDAFFPMPDCVELAHLADIDAIIQPGGSINDQKSIDACNDHDIAMVFSGERHFKH